MEMTEYQNSKKILEITHTFLFPVNNYLFCISVESSSVPGAGNLLVEKQKKKYALFSWSILCTRYFTF